MQSPMAVTDIHRLCWSDGDGDGGGYFGEMKYLPEACGGLLATTRETSNDLMLGVFRFLLLLLCSPFGSHRGILRDSHHASHPELLVPPPPFRFHDEKTGNQKER